MPGVRGLTENQFEGAPPVGRQKTMQGDDHC